MGNCFTAPLSDEERKLNSLFAYDREESELPSLRLLYDSLPGKCHFVELIQFYILNLFQKEKPGLFRNAIKIKPPLPSLEVCQRKL